MENWWNDTDRGKQWYTKKNVSHCRYVYHKSHTDWPGIESGRENNFVLQRILKIQFVPRSNHTLVIKTVG
jgi:hypothetical protein